MLQISQRPLQGTAVDAALFVNRTAELETLVRSVGLGFNALVLGDRGSGKTSLLRQLERQLADAGSETRFVEASGAGSVEDLVALVHLAVHGRRRDPDLVGLVRLAINGPREEGIAADVARLRLPDGQQVVVLIDSVAHPEVVQGLFGRLRDEVWELPITWIVTGYRSARSRYLETPADSFFDAVVELGELSVDEAIELLRRRARSAPIDDPVGQVLLGVAATLGQQVSPRTPRNLLAAAREVLLAGDDPTQWVTNQYFLQWRATGLSRPAAMLFTELMDLAPVSASDKRLLERLGWTRTRASQVFKQLEEAGLVVVTEEAPDGPGRPRKLYAPNARFHAVEQIVAPQ